MPNSNTSPNGSYSNSHSNLFLGHRSLNSQQFHSNNDLSRVINRSNNIGPDNNVFLSSDHNNFKPNPRNINFGQNSNSNTVLLNYDANPLIPNPLTINQSQRGPYGTSNDNDNNYLPIRTKYSVKTSLGFIDGELCLTQTVKETHKLTPMSTQVNPPTMVNEVQPTQSQNPNYNNNNNPNYYYYQQQPIYQNAPDPIPGYNQQQGGSGLSGVGDSAADMVTVEEGYDGMTHSLPCDKYGPYTCPSCSQVFTTTHQFASHVATHYKYESAEQRRRRHVARSRRKRPSDGIAPVVQQPFKRQQQ